jgi:hypothetical protein
MASSKFSTKINNRYQSSASGKAFTKAPGERRVQFTDTAPEELAAEIGKTSIGVTTNASQTASDDIRVDDQGKQHSACPALEELVKEFKKSSPKDLLMFVKIAAAGASDEDIRCAVSACASYINQVVIPVVAQKGDHKHVQDLSTTWEIRKHGITPMASWILGLDDDRDTLILVLHQALEDMQS